VFGDFRMIVEHLYYKIQIMSDTLAMYDVIRTRSLMFIKRCMSGESDLVRVIVQHGCFVRMYGFLYRAERSYL